MLGRQWCVAELCACFVSLCVDAAFFCLCRMCIQVGGQGERQSKA